MHEVALQAIECAQNAVRRSHCYGTATPDLHANANTMLSCQRRSAACVYSRSARCWQPGYDRLAPAEDSERRLGQAVRALLPRTTWHAQRLLSWTPHLRQFQARRP